MYNFRENFDTKTNADDIKDFETALSNLDNFITDNFINDIQKLNVLQSKFETSVNQLLLDITNTPSSNPKTDIALKNGITAFMQSYTNVKALIPNYIDVKTKETEFITNTNRFISDIPVPPVPPEPEKQGLSGGAIAAIVISIFIVLGVGGFFLYNWATNDEKPHRPKKIDLSHSLNSSLSEDKMSKTVHHNLNSTLSEDEILKNVVQKVPGKINIIEDHYKMRPKNLKTRK